MSMFCGLMLLLSIKPCTIILLIVAVVVQEFIKRPKIFITTQIGLSLLQLEPTQSNLVTQISMQTCSQDVWQDDASFASQQNGLVNEAGVLVYPIINLAQMVATSKWPILTTKWIV